jgi:single-strand DNA-binding protein
MSASPRYFLGGRRFKEMLSLNKAMIIGNVGTEPEMRFTPNGNPVTSFSVATNRVYTTPDGERRQETEWFSVVTWNRLAENCNQFLTKGQRVYAEGRLHTRTWEGQDGQKHSRLEIIANRVIFLDKRAAVPFSEERAEEGEVGEGGEGGEVGEVGELAPEDIPF